MKEISMKVLLAFTLITFVVCIAFSGCVENGSAEGEIPVNSEWELISFGPVGDAEPMLSATNITLEFEEKNEFSGSAGCNHYFGSYEIGEGNEISIGVIGSTEMWCQGEGIMDQENRYLSSLRNVTSFEIEGGNLKLFYNDGKGVLNFIASDSS